MSAATTAAPRLPPGSVIDGRYTIVGPIRERNGAITYEVADPNGVHLHATLYSPSCFPSALVLERSLRELRQLQSLNAPQLVRVLGSGRLPDGGMYELNECIDGPSLADELPTHRMSPSEVARVLSEIGEALLVAQKAGVIHRNLGASVVLRCAGGIKVTGFAVGEPLGGEAFGPPDTIAPEQLEGKVVDQRSLIYNLAALAHELHAGVPLFRGDAASIREVQAVGMPANVHPVVARGLVRDARMRPMMLKQFLSELATTGGGPTVSGQAQAATSSAIGQGTGGTAKPSTRGWTMFVEAQDLGAPTTAPAPVAVAPASMAPLAASPASVTPAGAAPSTATKPSTRGWTMFVEPGQTATAQASTTLPPSLPQPVAQPVPARPSEPSKPSAPPTAAAAPSTRGWTMFMEPGPSAQAQTTPAPASSQPSTVSPTSAMPPASTSVPVETAARAGTTSSAKGPSTRGWTMFMDSGAEAPSSPATVPSTVSPSPPVAEQARAAAPASGHAMATPSASGGPAPSTRGWTMFMDAPIPGQAHPSTHGPSHGPSGQQVMTPAASEAPTLSGPEAKGWTVFAQPGQHPVHPQQPMHASGQGAARAPVSGPMTSFSRQGQASAQATPDGHTAGAPAGRTVMASGLSPAAQPNPAAAGRTVFAGGPAGQPMPDTMYFKRGETEPERSAPRHPTPVEDIRAPVFAAHEMPTPAQTSSPTLPGRSAPVTSESSGGRGAMVALVIVVVLVLVGSVAAALLLL